MVNLCTGFDKFQISSYNEYEFTFRRGGLRVNIRLVKLTPAYRRHLEDMMREWLAVEQRFSPYAIRRLDYRDFDTYLANLERKEEKDGLVPDSVYFCLDQDRDIFVGAVNIRHYLNECICHTGGHIGDGIRPSERRKGYATAMIGLALEECRRMGINKVLMTCDADNIGSAKSIMNNGGVYEMDVEDEGVTEQRYWITLQEEVLHTPHLTLRRQLPGDYREVFAWASDPEVCRWLKHAPVKTPEELIPLLERRDPNSTDCYTMLMCRREDGRAVGAVGIFRDRSRDVWSVAYNVRRDEWGKGYACEAARAMIGYVKSRFHAHTIEGECAMTNQASARVLVKLGMTEVGRGSFEKHDSGEIIQTRIFRMTV